MKINISELWEQILFYISVPTCVCCKARLLKNESALCKQCIDKREKMKFRSCSRCGKKLDKCLCANEYLENHYVRRLAKCFRYMQREDMLALNAPIYSLKRHNRDDVLEFCANELASAIRNCYPKAGSCVFTNVPRSNKSIVKYGFDHAEMLAKLLAEQFGARYEKILISEVKTEQKKLHGKSRKENAQFSVINEIDLKGNNVIIIDDIVTTGSSMGAAAMLIHGLGAKRIFGAALGIAYKDKYTPFQDTQHSYTSY